MSTELVESQKAAEENVHLNLGLVILMSNREKVELYAQRIMEKKCNVSIEPIVKYVGSVVDFMSHFYNFIEKVTTKINLTAIPADMLEKIKPLLPNVDPSEYNTMLKLSQLIRRNVSDYSITILKSMNCLKLVPTDVNVIKKQLLRNKRRGKGALTTARMKRLLNIEELRDHCKTLGTTASQGRELANIFFENFQNFANVPEGLRDYVKELKKLNDTLANSYKELASVIGEITGAQHELKVAKGNITKWQSYIKELNTAKHSAEENWKRNNERALREAQKEAANASNLLRDASRRNNIFTYWWTNGNTLRQCETQDAYWKKEVVRLTAANSKQFSGRDNIKEKKLYSERLKHAQKDESDALKRIAQYQCQMTQLEITISSCNNDLLKKKQAKDKVMEKYSDGDESVDRLIDAVTATQSFGIGALSQTMTQIQMTDFGKKSIETIFFGFDDLFEEGISLDDQLAICEDIKEDIADDTGLFKFLNDSRVLTNYPKLKSGRLEQIRKNMPQLLLVDASNKI